MTCWNCERDAGGARFCRACGKLQPVPRGTDHFAVMEIERRYHVAGDAIERRFRELSRKLHPDKFARTDATERRHAMQWTTALNDAYRVIRDDVKRGEYILAREGFDVGAERSGKAAEIGLSPEFLMEMLERREALGEAREAGDRTREATMFAEVRGAREVAMRFVDEHFSAWEQNERLDTKSIAAEFSKIRYFARFLGEDDDDRREQPGAEVGRG